MKKYSLSFRVLCAVLALCSVLTMSPVALADTMEEPTQTIEQPIAETPETEQSEPVSESTTPEENIDATTPEDLPQEEEPETTAPEDIPEEDIPVETVPENTQPEETIPEETVPEESIPEESVPEQSQENILPYGLTGMPEDYVLTEEQKQKKIDITEQGVLEAMEDLIPGQDYAQNQVFLTADSLEEAQQVAAAYNGIVESYEYHVAIINLQSCSTLEAIQIAADVTNNLPAVSPNTYVEADPVISQNEQVDMTLMGELPVKQSWSTWMEIMENPDPYLSDPYSSTYQWMHDAVNTYEAWGVTTGESYVKVAVIDSGVTSNHAELSGKVTPINISLGTSDASGHGTHVAGIIAATMDNGSGGAGIAPGVNLMSVRVADSYGKMSQANLVKAIYAAGDNGAWIINMSLGGWFYNSDMQQAINYVTNYQDVTVIAAAGNDGTNIKCFPAAYNNVIAVASTDKNDKRSSFSSYGSWVDVAAPGMDIMSTYYSSYASMDGTSMACPVVTGVAALYMSHKGHVSPAQMEKVLKASCRKGSSELGAGVIDAAKMFGKTKSEVFYGIMTDETIITETDYSGEAVPVNSSLFMFSEENDNNGVVIYTINGKSPAMKNGKLAVGTVFDPSEDDLISLTAYAGQTITVKAACVNGIGLMGAVQTFTIKVDDGIAIESITIEGSQKLIAGKSCTYSAVLEPSATVNQAVTWSIAERSAGMSGAKISSKGKLTTSSKQSGWVKIRATAKKDGTTFAEITVTVEKIKPVSSMALNTKSATLILGTGNAADTQVGLYVAKMVDSAKNPIDPSLSGIKWSSSKTSVATVDQYGNVTAVAPGSATITCKTLDGSGKSATCKITVKQRVMGISVVGNSAMSPGGTATYKAVCTPTNATSKSVTWSLVNAPSGAKIDAKGKATLPKDATSFIGNTFTVVATAKDGSGIVGSIQVSIQQKCTGLIMSYDVNTHDDLLVKRDKKGNVTAATLYTEDVGYYNGNDEGIQLCITGKNLTPDIKWSSSSPSVATVDESGYVKALKKGTAKITATAQDGSGKKATVTVTVQVPVSYISLHSSLPTNQLMKSWGYGDISMLGCGCSATTKVVFGDTYGVPTNKAVKWSYVVEHIYSGGAVIEDVTEVFRAKKLVTMKNGKVTVSSKVQSYRNKLDAGDYMITVTATSVDNPSVSSSMSYLVTGKTSKITPVQKSFTIYQEPSGYAWYAPIVVKQGTSDRGAAFDLPKFGQFTAKSSNPNVCGVYTIKWDAENEYYNVLLIPGTKTGSATITIKAADGSGKSCSFKAYVK